jgi:hypothetical protein
VPLLEWAWRRQDGLTADREHLLMALADLDYIVIRAREERQRGLTQAG